MQAAVLLNGIIIMIGCVKKVMSDYLTHVIIKCESEYNTRLVYGWLDGAYPLERDGRKYVIPTAIAREIGCIRRVAPRVIRVDKKYRSDIDLAQLKQYLVAMGLIESFEEVQELEGLTS